MIDVDDAVNRIVMPALADVFNAGEVSAIAVRLDPELEGGSITVSLTVEGEQFHDLVVQGNVPGHDVGESRERLRSNLADWVAESGFGWGQDRGV